MVRSPALLAVVTAAAFFVFAQAFMVPVLPRLAQVFGVGMGVVSPPVPTYLVPYGLMTLLWGRWPTCSADARSSCRP